MITFELTTADYKKRIARFLETGAPPPEGATLLGRWITLGHNRGYMLAESDTPKTIFRWVCEWNDLINFEVHPVIDSNEAGEVLGAI